MIESNSWSVDDYLTFLHFRYYPAGGKTDIPPQIRSAISNQTLEYSKPELLERGEQCILQSIKNHIKNASANNTHVVPLSGGLDSRTILAALITSNKVDQQNIKTVSFGSPRTWDFELGQQIARAAGVKNIAIDLTSPEVDWSIDNLLNVAQSSSKPVPILEARANRLPVENFESKNTIFWSGFMGDPSVGSHQPSNPHRDWELAKSEFIDNNLIIGDSPLHKPDFVGQLPSEAYFDESLLTYEEQLDFAIRQENYIRPTVVPDEQYLTPFACDEWLSFWLNIPRDQRRGRKLFRQVVYSAFPDLFSLPSSTNYGLPITSSRLQGNLNGVKEIAKNWLYSKIYKKTYTHPNTNYLNFESAIRGPHQLHKSAEYLLESFEERDILEINLSSIWDQHQAGEDHTELIRSVMSLESHLLSN
ncbi:asparagine synthase-related protein [Haloprofundus halobius]|uniref:asparagine synthase-related protein n=1 Tax=Haloprofundus halobius TaxID=2876194 RepID=UPI001CCBD6A5|nr:asparagine synthase-related protein [Haloprofundus halobius]